MYRTFVRRQIRHVFSQLSEGNWPELLARMSPDVQHTFAGTSALGGSRRGIAAVTAWSQRLQRLLPDLAFEVHTVVVDGGPLNTRVGVEWTNTAPLPDGTTYTNRGAHLVAMSRGRITAFHAYLDDTAALDRALMTIADTGLAEAEEAPLD